MVATGQKRKLEPGSHGWTSAMLDESAYERDWEVSRLELVHGVLAAMSPKLIGHVQPVGVLIGLIHAYMSERDIDGIVGPEPDIQVNATTRYVPDVAVFMPEDLMRQERLQPQLRPGKDPGGVVVIPPTVITESVSEGHEAHDEVVKFEDYARFGVPNYWIANAATKTFRGWRLIDGRYQPEFDATEGDVEPAVFPGLSIPLHKLFR